jgi:hypothetical protein
MALNSSKIKQVNQKINKQEPLDAGNYLSRVVQVIDLGLQPQRPYLGEAKPPAHEIMLTYELGTEFLKDEDGNDMEDKPRWVSETFPLRSMHSDLAKSTKRMKALDPKDTLEGDFARLPNTPCTVTIVQNPGKGDHAGKVFINVGQITPPR